jgi:PAS domain-containing protein
VAFGFLTADRMAQSDIPVLDALSLAELEATRAHRQIETIINGSSYENVDSAIRHLEISMSQILSVFEELTEARPHSTLPENGKLRAEVQNAKANLIVLKDLIWKRIAAVDIPAAREEIDKSYDERFHFFLDDINKIKANIQEVKNSHLARFRASQLTLLLVIFLVALTMGFIIHRFERRSSSDFNTLKRTNLQLASEISERRRAEDELRKVQENLESEIQSRTADLSMANRRLQMTIGELRKAQEALKGERDRFMGILEAMGDGVYVTNSNHQIEYLNPLIEREFGPFSGEKCHAYFENRSEECPRCSNQQVFSGETVRWTWTSPKNLKTYDSFATPIRNPDGTLSKLEIFRDISELKRSEAILHQSELKYKKLSQEFNTLLNAIDDTLVLISPEM